MQTVEVKPNATVYLMSTRGSGVQTALAASTVAVSPALETDRISELMGWVLEQLPMQRRLVYTGDTVSSAGNPCTHLYVVNAGSFKVVNTSLDGNGQVVGLNFRGDWLGFDGIAMGRYSCDTVSMDIGEVWALRYEVLVHACTVQPSLLAWWHAEMSREIHRGRESLLSICTLPVRARVASFLCHWADAMALRGQRADQITVRMTRAEIGSYLGMTVESVSRALSTLVRDKMIRFTDSGRRDIVIPDLPALAGFIRDQSRSVGTDRQ
jgi:CRP/FNR family transcriptional regulator